MDNFNSLLSECFKAFHQTRVAKRVKDIAHGLVICFGRHTVAGMITGCGKQFVDWSAAYRVFSQNRIEIGELFSVITKTIVEQQQCAEYIVAHVDDTLIRKRGKQIPGTSWKRDPLGPAFHTNFVWAQRYIQISMATFENITNCQSRALPVDFHHCPPATKPKAGATLQEPAQYKQEQKKVKLSTQGSMRITALREKLDQLPTSKLKQLLVSVDGSYTNEEVLKNLPDRTTLIGRIRKDTKLFTTPTENSHTGRKKIYGDQIPTPEEIRQNDKIAWSQVEAWAAGKSHLFDVKVMHDLKWKPAGKEHVLQLVVVRPLGYRLNKTARVLYRQPAYLICTDNNLSIEKLLQAYLWRWEIEVNFRDEKTILGCGQAQVRNENAVKNLPAFTTAIYSLLHLAAQRSNLERNKNVLAKAKWDKVENKRRLSTSEIINLFRCQKWNKTTRTSFDGFVKNQGHSKSHQNSENPLLSAMFYARE